MKRIFAFLVITLGLTISCVTYYSFRGVHGEHRDVQYEDFTIGIAIVSSSKSRGLNYYRVGLRVFDTSTTNNINDSLIIDSVCIELLDDHYQICPVTMQNEPFVKGIYSRNVFIPDNTDSIMISFSIGIYNRESKKIIKGNRVLEKLYRTKKRNFEFMQ